MILSAVIAQICDINMYIAPVPFVMGLPCHVQWNILTGKNNKNLIISRPLQLGKFRLTVQKTPSHTNYRVYFHKLNLFYIVVIYFLFE